MDINVIDLNKILRYLQYRKSFRDYIFLKMVIETELKIQDLFKLRISDVLGTNEIKAASGDFAIISDEMVLAIYRYAEFSEPNDFLFEGNQGKAISHVGMWKSINKAFKECGYEEIPTIPEMQKIFRKEKGGVAK